VSRRWQSNGEWQEHTTFLNLNIWATLGENAAASLSKGDRVIVQGRLEQRSWDNDEGEKRTVFEVTVDAIGPDLRWAQATVEKTERSSAPKDDPGPASGAGGSSDAYPNTEKPF